MFLLDKDQKNHEKHENQTPPWKRRDEMPRGIYLHCGEYSWWELQAHQEREGGRPSQDPLQLWVDQ